ncbi:MAG: hypothetical protein ACRD4T_04115, partial [Candidatus Acidiferrales bacterium]
SRSSLESASSLRSMFFRCWSSRWASSGLLQRSGRWIFSSREESSAFRRGASKIAPQLPGAGAETLELLFQLLDGLH